MAKEGQEQGNSEESKHGSAEDADRLLGTANIITIIIVVFALLAIGFYLFKVGSFTFSNSLADWGQSGDYFGGIINPAVGLATVLLIFIGIHIQRSELRATERQLRQTVEATRIQNFENALFSWIERYESLIESVEEPAAGGHRGRNALIFWYEKKFSSYQGYFDRTVKAGTLEKAGHDIYLMELKGAKSFDDFSPADISFLNLGISEAVGNYLRLYETQISSLDAPLRSVYRMIRWIDKSKLTAPQKWHYIALIRAQLSWIEMVYLLFNGMTEYGKKFREYADRYAIFDNLSSGSDFNVWFARVHHSTDVYTGGNRYYQAAAFDSQIAKAKLGIPLDA